MILVPDRPTRDNSRRLAVVVLQQPTQPLLADHLPVRHNGVLIHDDYELKSGTGKGGQRPEVAKAMLWLQNHTGTVRFRNVWLSQP